MQDRRSTGAHPVPLVPSTAHRSAPCWTAVRRRREGWMPQMSGVEETGAPGPDRGADRPRPGGRAAWCRGPGRRRPDHVRGGGPRPGGGDGGGRRAAGGRDPQEQSDRHPQGERRPGGTHGDPLPGADRRDRAEPGRLRVHGNLRLPGTALLRRGARVRQPADRLDRPRHRGVGRPRPVLDGPDGGVRARIRRPGAASRRGAGGGGRRLRVGGGAAPSQVAPPPDRARATWRTRVAPRYRGAWPPTRTSPRSRSGSPVP